MSDAISTLFRNVLGRDADPNGTAHFQAELNAGESLDDIRHEMAYSDEAAADINAIFLQTSGRAATGDELSLFKNALSQGGDWNLGSVRWNVAHTYATSAVHALYNDIEGIEAGSADYAWAELNLGSGATLDTLRPVLAHTGQAAYSLNCIYRDALDVDATAGQVTFWEDNALSNGATLANIREAMAPQAAGAIGWLFQNVLGRAATANDQANWQYQLGHAAASIASMRLAFAHTADAAAGINATYLQMFGHGADDPGLMAAYEDNMGSESVQWSQSTVRWDLAHRPEATADIIGLYQQVLGYTPASAQVQFWEDNALAQGNSVAQVRYALATSPEAPGAINTLYQQVLGRNADPAGSATDLGELAGGKSLSDIRDELAHSDEAVNDIDAVYSNDWSRSPAPNEISFWEAQLDAGTSMAAIRLAFSLAPEAAAQIRQVYKDVLGRTDVQDWEIQAQENSLQNGYSIAGLRHDLAWNEGYAAVANLYQQVLGRAASPGDIAGQQALLAQGKTLDQVRYEFATSPEAGNDINAIYLQVAGRAASGDELSLFENALSQGGAWNLGSVRWNIAHTDAASAAVHALYNDIEGAEQTDRSRSSAATQLVNSPQRPGTRSGSRCWPLANAGQSMSDQACRSLSVGGGRAFTAPTSQRMRRYLVNDVGGGRAFAASDIGLRQVQALGYINIPGTQEQRLQPCEGKIPIKDGMLG